MKKNEFNTAIERGGAFNQNVLYKLRIKHQISLKQNVTDEKTK